MSAMKVNEIWAEMARRKVQFHRTEEWDQINLWGLFLWNEIKRQLDRGELITHMGKENKIIWVQPSKETWEKKIKPLIKNYTLEELTEMAGWR